MINTTHILFRENVLEPLRKTVEANDKEELTVPQERRHEKRKSDLKVLDELDSQFQHSMLLSETLIQIMNDIKADIMENNGVIRVSAASKVLKIGDSLQDEYGKMFEDE